MKQKNLVNLLFFKAALNIFLHAENDSRAVDISKNAKVSYCYFSKVIKAFISEGLILKDKKHRYFLTNKGDKIKKKLLEIYDNIK